MNLFRSEEHLERWLDANGREAGAILDSRRLWLLAEAWWSDRLAPNWVPHTRGQNQAILAGLGLTTPFWQLP